MTRTGFRWLAFVIAGLAMAAAVPAAQLRGIGIEGRSADVLAGPEAVPRDERPLLRVHFECSVDREMRSFLREELARLQATLDAADGRWRVIVMLWPSDETFGTLRPRNAAYVDAWLAAVTDLGDMAARHDVVAWEIADRVVATGAFADDAFVFKKTVAALKAATPDALVAWCAFDDGRGPDWLEIPQLHAPTPAEIEASGVLPYIDAFALDVDEPMPQTEALIAARGPAVPVWEHGWTRAAGASDGDEPMSTWALLLDARARGVPVATIGGGADEHFNALYPAYRRAFPLETEPLEGPSPVTFPAEAPLPARALIVPSVLSYRIVFGPAPADVRRKGAFVLARIADAAENIRIVDPLGQFEGPVKSIREAGGVTAIELPLASRALVLAWDRAASPDELKEDAGVSGEHEPTLDEILARHAERRARRQHQVKTWSADLTTTMRYQAGGSGRSIEVRIESRYYEGAGGLKEIENRRFFINGAPYAPRKGQPPELPLIQPEKITIVPLEIQLDKSYEYELRGKSIRSGRLAWRLAFRPVAGDATAWAGTAWIDAKTYDLLATDFVQSGLAPPILSNQQLESYGAVPSGDGEAWLVREIDTRRVMSILGNNVVVDIGMAFGDPVVNGSSFEAQLDEARASDRQMLRDTDEGLRYLRKNDEGERVPVEATATKLFVIAGARVDESYEAGFIPLAGVNWLNNDAWGKGIQVNAFLAGAINDVSISDPSLWGSKTNLTFEAFVPLVKQADRLRGPLDTDDDVEAASREPRLSVGVGRPVGSLAQVGFETRLSHQAWSDTDDTSSDFAVPHDTLVVAAIGTFEVHAGGWDARASVERAERTEWEAWGPLDAAGDPTIRSASGYWRWRVGVGRTFRPTLLQSITLEAESMGGDDLDRFSQYEFSAFGGAQLPGFEGTGIHFDEANMVHLTWGLSLFGRLGIDVSVGAARTRNAQLSAADLAEIGFRSTHVGIGLGGTVPGPWRTIVRFDVGAPISSPDYDGIAGRATAQVLFTKLLR